MGKETSKAYERRLKAGYFDKYLIGHGIDIGCGDDKLVIPGKFYITVDEISEIRGHNEVDGWDKENGDAQTLPGIKDEVYDFVYSSHCLEHLDNPSLALANWWRVLKSGGYLFVVVPDEDLYEQGVWPSRGNGEHKTTWSILKGNEERWNKFVANPHEEPIPDSWKNKSWSPVSRNVVEEIDKLSNHALVSISLIDVGYDYEIAKQGWFDQSGVAEVGIEFIVRKLG